MKTLGLALLVAASTVIGGCGSLGNLNIGDLHPGDSTAAKPAQAELLSSQTEDALYLGAIDGLEKQQRFGAALAFLDQYAAQEKDLPPRYWLLRGNALTGTSKYPEAAEAFEKLDATPLAAEGWNGKGRASAAAGLWAEASFGFQNAVLGNPSNAEFLNNLGYAQLHLGRAAEAEGNLRQAYELSPQSDLIRNNFAIALSMTGDAAGAAEILRTIKDDVERERVASLARKFAQSKTLEEKS